MGYSFISAKTERIQIDKLSYAFCQEHSDELLKIINIIPYVRWTIGDLLSQDEDFFGNKWNYSYVVKNSENEIIGVLIAYFRISDSKHIFDSLYLHRFAITPQYQNIGIGTETLKYFIKKSFVEIPWLLNITVQTNDNSENKHVVRFYRNVGFKDMYNIQYSYKKDILFLLERKSMIGSFKKEIDKDRINLRHPRFNVAIIDTIPKNVLPVIYFSSTNEKKKQIIQFIFHNYNIDVCFVNPPIELTEPQIERPELEEERKLVSVPLKTVSRFINTVPYIIEDTMLFVEYFNKNGKVWELPGLDTKRWLRQMGLDGLLEIMGNTNKRKARFVSQTGAYIKPNKYFYGRGEVFGTIAYKEAEIINPKYGTYPYFFHLIFIPDGADKTLAEMDMYEFAKYDYMRKSIVHLIDEFSRDPLYRQCHLFDLLEEGYNL